MSMAMLMRLEHVVIKNGRKTFRRRVPQDLLKVIPKTFFQETMREQEDSVALVREHAALMDAFQCMVTDARTGHLAEDDFSGGGSGTQNSSSSFPESVGA